MTVGDPVAPGLPAHHGLVADRGEINGGKCPGAGLDLWPGRAAGQVRSALPGAAGPAQLLQFLTDLPGLLLKVTQVIRQLLLINADFHKANRPPVWGQAYS